MAKIERALISVWDKTGLVPFARTLFECGIELISTGGTARVLREAGLPVIDVSQLTGFPEMLDGRVKTLHPYVHAALLYVRGKPEHEDSVRRLNIRPIDLVVVNLYPFEQTVSRPGVTFAEAIENIDIGGPAMLRSAAKNHESVTVVVDPTDYHIVAEQIKTRGETTAELRRQLAMKVFATTARYDMNIANYLAAPIQGGQAPAFPSVLGLILKKCQDLRYGENPHQSAALYGEFEKHFRQLHGKELSYNNILDIASATALICEFLGDPPTVAIVKHTNPCGVGTAETLKLAWEKAFATDTQAPFGGIIAVNTTLDGACATAIAEIFTEVILAPAFTPEALARLTSKKNLRLIQYTPPPDTAGGFELRSVGFGSCLVQTPDLSMELPNECRVVTKRGPTPEELQAMRFGWRVVKHVKSNAIVFASRDRTLGIGAGQMSRVDACRIAISKAQQAGLNLKGSVVCSDAFFPFPDGLVVAAEAGATAAIQPGGSVRDPEVIAAADKYNMAMIFTGVRHFRH